MTEGGTSPGPTILAIDIGLTNVKVVVFDATGRMLGRESLPYPTTRPGPDRVEQDPEDWLATIARAAHALWARDPAAPARVAAISVTAHMHALVCLGGDGRHLGPALVLGDRRAVGHAELLTQAVGAAEVHTATGAELDASMPAAKIAWLLDQAPEMGGRTRTFLACKDYVRHCLTGDLLTDPIDACATSLYDIAAGAWWPPILEAVGIDEGRLPEVRPPDSIAGTLLPEVAGTLGLPAGIPVVVGGGDDVEVLGNGLLGAGDALEHLGTTGSILTVSDRLTLDPERRLETYPHAIAGLWVMGGSMTTAGAAVTAACDLLGASTEEAFAALAANPLPGPADPVFLPDLAGLRAPVRAPHATGGWLGVTPETRRESLLAASYRGVAYGLRRILARIEDLAGRQRVITVSGGYDVDPAWLQLRASAYDRPLAMLETTEPTALGAAILGAAGVGLHPGIAAAVRATARRTGGLDPVPAQAEALRRDYRRWLRFGDALLDAWDPRGD